MRKRVFFLSLVMFQIIAVILAEHCSLQMLLIYTAIDRLHTHTHPWPASDLGCSNTLHIQSCLPDLKEDTQHRAQVSVMPKYHNNSSPSMAPKLKPISINICFSKRLTCLALDSLYPSIPSVQAHKKQPCREHTARLHISILRESQPPNLWGDYSEIGISSSSVQESVSENEMGTRFCLAQVCATSFSLLVKLQRGILRLKKKKEVNHCNPAHTLLGLRAELPAQAARWKVLVDLELYLIAFGEIFVQKQPCSSSWLCRLQRTVKSALNIHPTYWGMCAFTSMVSTKRSVSKFPSK